LAIRSIYKKAIPSLKRRAKTIKKDDLKVISWQKLNKSVSRQKKPKLVPKTRKVRTIALKMMTSKNIIWIRGITRIGKANSKANLISRNRRTLMIQKLPRHLSLFL
jgi:hypothetical protein